MFLKWLCIIRAVAYVCFLSRRVRGAERLDACFKEHGIEALVAFLA